MKSGRTPMHSSRDNKLREKQSSCGSAHDLLNVKNQDPVNVFCRLRPLQCEPDLTCAQVISPTTLILKQPEQAVMGKAIAQRGMQYIFKHIFEADATQRQVFKSVAEPLVENLLHGKNSLLFTYGVTGSGKTFTMTGDGRQPGIMPRCLGLLFRAINDYQAQKYVFKSDKLNGFEILSAEDALLERQAEMHQRFEHGSASAKRRKEYDPELASQSICEATVPPSGIDEDNMYAVFVTYVEVYNNSVFDLLDANSKVLQSKVVREDANHRIFVHGVTEIEVKSVEESLDAFYMGQRRKRMAHTTLNAESSRSHSVFTIRLVQAPTDCQGEEVIQDKRCIIVSQLSLVDLAGSERSARTQNTGVRLREAGNINNSLMSLRTCLEYLRENQQVAAGGTLKKIPYRDSKITHLFKNYLEGEGQVSMIVCINPRVEDYDENSQVLKFAEMAQEVQVARPISNYKQDIGLTPGRRKANKIMKIAQKNMGFDDIAADVGLIYSFDPGFPEYSIDSPECESIIHNLMDYLALRIEKRKILSANLSSRFDAFRVHLMEMEKENLNLRTELTSMKAVHKIESNRMQAVENKLRLQENTIAQLNAKLANRERQIDDLTRKLNCKQKLITQKEQETEKQKKKFNYKLAVEVDKKDKELETRLREQRAKLENNIRVQDEKLRLVANIVQASDFPHSLGVGLGRARTKSVESLAPATGKKPAHPPPTASSRCDIYATPAHNGRRVVAANNRHRRSRSAEEKWIEHRAPNPVPLGTILQPYLKNRKSVTKLPEVKDLTENRATKYCLISQDADTEGEVETKLYKGNVIPTCGGGAQVVFNDVEHLKQTSPLSSPRRKRRSNGNDEQHQQQQQQQLHTNGGSIDNHPSKSEKYFF